MADRLGGELNSRPAQRLGHRGGVHLPQAEVAARVGVRVPPCRRARSPGQAGSDGAWEAGMVTFGRSSSSCRRCGAPFPVRCSREVPECRCGRPGEGSARRTRSSRTLRAPDAGGGCSAVALACLPAARVVNRPAVTPPDTVEPVVIVAKAIPLRGYMSVADTGSGSLRGLSRQVLGHQASM